MIGSSGPLQDLSVNGLITATAYKASALAWRRERGPGRGALSAPSNADQGMTRLSFRARSIYKNGKCLSTINPKKEMGLDQGDIHKKAGRFF
jgi:hypothetical protein